jgi:D-threo-aldose 1-dehydrogenase
MTEFPLRQIGHTGLQVTELGLGCATLGGSQIAIARAAAEEIVDAAWAAGVRYVDTAPYYGVGQAERCVGDALRDRPRGEWVLSTKVGRLLRRNPTGAFADERGHPLPFEAVYDYSYDGIMRSFEDSFQRLGLARIDILYVHDIGAYQHGAEANAMQMKTLRESGYRALETLRSAGEVAAIGIGVNEREVLLEAMEWGAWDVFLLAGRYTLLEQAPLDDLLRRSSPSSQGPATPLSSTPISSCCATRSRPRCGRICGRQACSIPKPPSRARHNDLGQQRTWGDRTAAGRGATYPS